MNIDFLVFVVGALTGVLTGLAAISAERIGNLQNRLGATSVAADWLRDLRSWASSAVDVIAEATYFCELEDNTQVTGSSNTTRCRHCLSALIDQGRFYLPNERRGEFGAHKPQAYRGLRHPALDALVAAHRILSGEADLLSFSNRKSALIGVNREFVSSIQSILNPQSVNRTVAKVLRAAHEDMKKDPTLGGLLPDPAKVPKGAAGVIYTASKREAKSVAHRRAAQD